MDYKNKYIKYKKLYSNLKNFLKGGYLESDENRQFISLLLQKNIDNRTFKKKNVDSFIKVLDFLKNRLTEKRLNLVYNKLIKLLMNNVTKYSKKHKTKIGGSTINDNDDDDDDDDDDYDDDDDDDYDDDYDDDDYDYNYEDFKKEIGEIKSSKIKKYKIWNSQEIITLFQFLYIIAKIALIPARILFTIFLEANK